MPPFPAIVHRITAIGFRPHLYLRLAQSYGTIPRQPGGEGLSGFAHCSQRNGALANDEDIKEEHSSVETDIVSTTAYLPERFA